MGTCYIIVNPAKRQFFEIERFGENEKWPLALAASHIVSGPDKVSVHVHALAYLLVHPKNFRSDLMGAWSGDAVYLPSDHHGADEAGMSFGIHTATPEDPGRSLYGYAYENYENISIPIIDALCDWDWHILDILLSRSTSGDCSPSLWEAMIKVLDMKGAAYRLFETRHSERAEELYKQIHSLIASFEADLR